MSARAWLGGLLGLTAALPGCEAPQRCGPPLGQTGENVLVILSDDIGIDKTSAYGPDTTGPGTPNIDALAARGLLFRNAYATPTCSPTRATLLTGRLPTRHGIGRWIYADEDADAVELEELSLAEALRHAPACTSSGWLGKWHMVGFHREHPALHPTQQGFDRYAGSLSNPNEDVRGDPKKANDGYFRWEKTTDGDRVWTDAYMATDTTDEALRFVRTHPEPWVAVVAYNLAHVPLHVPPGDLNLTGVTEDSSDLDKYHAMVAALDAEVGRLVDGLPAGVAARTNIIYLSDNGTVTTYIEPPWNSGRAKGSVYDGGVRVPMIMAGPRVPYAGAETEALVHVADLFPTILEIAGIDPAELRFEEGERTGEPVPLDGHSLLELLADPGGPGPRDLVYTEGFYPNGFGLPEYHLRMVRDAGWKLIRKDEGMFETYERLYHYEEGALDEGPPLLESWWGVEELRAYARLSAHMRETVEELDDGR